MKKTREFPVEVVVLNPNIKLEKIVKRNSVSCFHSNNRNSDFATILLVKSFLKNKKERTGLGPRPKFIKSRQLHSRC